jgi:hypothetical protein
VTRTRSASGIRLSGADGDDADDLAGGGAAAGQPVQGSSAASAAATLAGLAYSVRGAGADMAEARAGGSGLQAGPGGQLGVDGRQVCLDRRAGW